MTTWNLVTPDGGPLHTAEELALEEAVDAIEAIDGIIKSNGAGTFSEAIPGTDYASPFWVNVLDYGADRTGATDSTAAFNAARAALAFWGGRVYMPAGNYKISSTLSYHEFQALFGDGIGMSVINYVGSGPCIDANSTVTITGDVHPITMGDFSIDGTGAAAGAIGFQIGDLYYSQCHNIVIQNFSGAGSIGLNFKNTGSVPDCEKINFTGIGLYFNTNNIVFDNSSFDYSTFDFYVVGGANQNGISLKNNTILAGCRLAMRGNFAAQGIGSNTGIALGIDVGNTSGTSGIRDCEFDICVEPNGTGVAHQTINLGGTSSVLTGTGTLVFNSPVSGHTPFVGASIHAGSRFGVMGRVHDPVLGLMLLGDAATFDGGTQYNVKGSATTAFVNSQAISPQLGDFQEYLLASGVNTIGSIGATIARARRLEVLWHQPASGAPATLALPSNVHLLGTLSTANGAIDKMVLTYFPSDDAWFGEIVGRTTINPVVTAVKTADYTAAVNDFVLISGAHTVTLPTAPADGSRVVVTKMDSGTTTTIAAAGSDVLNTAGGATTVVLLGQYQTDTLQYTASNGVWHIVSTAFSLSYLNSLYLNQNLIPSIAVKTADYTASVNDLVLMSGAHTVTLPSAPADKSQIGVTKMDSGTVTTIATSGTDVFNVGAGATSVVLLGQYQTDTFQYTAATGIWRIVSTVFTLAYLNSLYLNQNTTGNAATATKLATARNINGVAFDGTADITVVDSTAEKTVNKNAANGYAGLDSGGKLPAALWPAGIDEVIEYANLAAFPGTGASQIIYLALDTGKEYRWSGSVYVEISPSPGSTDSVTEGSTNLYYTNARADARVAAGNAGTATKLAATKNIDGIAFDGSADIFTEQWIAQLSTFTLASSTSFQALFATTAPTNGALTLAIGTYAFECAFSLTSLSSTSGNFGFGFGGTATFNQAWQSNAAKTVGASSTGAPATGFFIANAASISPVNTNTAGDALIKGLLRVTAAGTIIPQTSLSVAAAAIVGAGSHFRIKQISNSGTTASVGSWS